jgi:hypothetical protein
MVVMQPSLVRHRTVLAGILVCSAWSCGGGAASTDAGGNGGSSGTASTAASGTGAGGTATTGSSSAGTATTSSGSTGFVPKTVFTIVLENHDYKEVVGSTNAPYINNTLIANYGLATNYMDSGTHPSLPNYLYMISGATQYFGIVDLDPTDSPFPVSAPNLGNQLNTANVKWRSYQESMGMPCQLAAVGTLYAPKHDGFLYFTDLQSPASACDQQNVDYSGFAADLAGGTYRYNWITPNLTDDGHDPSTDPVAGLMQTDMWLSTEVPKILASASYKDGGVLFITWDEAEGRNGDSPDQVAMIIVTTGIKAPGYKSNVAYSHASYLATVEDIFGVPRLGAAVGASSMKEFWQ